MGKGTRIGARTTLSSESVGPEAVRAIMEMILQMLSKVSGEKNVRRRAKRKNKAMKNTLISGLWLALVIGLPAGAGAGSARLGLGLSLTVFLAAGVAPVVWLRMKAKT